MIGKVFSFSSDLFRLFSAFLCFFLTVMFFIKNQCYLCSVFEVLQIWKIGHFELGYQIDG